MPLKVVDAIERKIPRHSQRLGKVDAHEEGSRESRAVCDGDSIQIQVAIMPLHDVTQQSWKGEEVLARGDLRHDAAESRVDVRL